VKKKLKVQVRSDKESLELRSDEKRLTQQRTQRADRPIPEASRYLEIVNQEMDELMALRHKKNDTKEKGSPIERMANERY
jgi:hypothetical protein